MIKKFLNKRKVNKAWIEAAIEDTHREGLTARKQLIKNIENNMLSSPCAINSMDNCDRKCVHFKSGTVSTLLFMNKTYIDSRNPKCKLWS